MDEIDHLKEWNKVAKECAKPYANSVVVEGLDQLRALQRGEPFKRARRDGMRSTRSGLADLDPKMRDTILHETGTCAGVARMYGVSYQMVRDIWTDAGRPLGRPGDRTASRWPA